MRKENDATSFGYTQGMTLVLGPIVDKKLLISPALHSLLAILPNTQIWHPLALAFKVVNVPTLPSPGCDATPYENG